MSRSEILNRVKSATEKITKDIKEPKKACFSIKNEGDLVQNFLTNLKNNKTQVIECKQDELEDEVKKALEEIGAKKILHYKSLPIKLKAVKNAEFLEYDKSANEFGEELFDCDTSVVKARFGISNFGLLCLTSDEQPRLMSLLPQKCIVLLKKEDIIESINHAHEELAKQKLPQNIIFVAGPSRTADIELQLVLGVHGPQEVIAIVY